MKVFTNSEQETMRFAQDFAKQVRDKDVILLLGDLGSGKTHFVKGLVEGLGCDEVVTSPTFTIHNIYEGGRLTVNQFDMYRLDGAEEALALGFDEYFDRDKLSGISVVEWPENVEGLIRDYTVEVKITKLGNDRREIEIRRQA